MCIPDSDCRNFRTDIPALPFGSLIDLTAKKPKSSKYPKTLLTIGDHIRKRRLDLKLFQAEVARLIGVTESTVTNWEKNQTEPMLWVMPKVIEFLGYEPNLFITQSFGQSIKSYRLLRGITQEELAHHLSVDPSTLGRWERDESRPNRRLMKRFKPL